MALIIERLAAAIAPVLCHMAEDIWQNIPYSTGTESVFLSGWPSVPEDWRDDSLQAPMQELRELLFKDADSTVAHETIPDGRTNVPDEVRRYKSLTLTGRVGWEPPYLHNRKLPGRLHRLSCPTAIVWGGHDRLIPLASARAYAENIPQSSLQVLDGSGHSPILEQPDECVASIADFLETGNLPAGDAVISAS